jgi:hypothetical protein
LVIVLRDQYNNPIDISTATEITASFANADGSVLTLTFSDSGGITIGSGPGGKAIVIISAEQSALLEPSVAGGYSDIQGSYTLSGAPAVPFQLPSSIQVNPPLVS